MQSTLIIAHLPELIASLLIAILFIQSGLDKVLDWRGNLEWLNGHFAKSIFARSVVPLLATITVMEIATGILALAGLINFFINGTVLVIFYAAALGAATITALFFGQRVAKDYAGAAALVPYFILLMFLMMTTRPALPL